MTEDTIVNIPMLPFGPQEENVEENTTTSLLDEKYVFS